MVKVDPAETFRQEAADLLAGLETALLDLEAAPGDRDLIDQVFRSLHTLKGSGGMFGWDALAAFTHHVESAIQRVRDGGLAVDHALVALTLAAADHIRALLTNPDAADPVRGEALLVAFRDLGGVSEPAIPAPPQPQLQAQPQPQPQSKGADALRVYRIRWRPGPEVLAFGTQPVLLLDELRALGTATVVPLLDRVPPLEDMDPTGCYLAWDVVLTTKAPRSEVEGVFLFVADRSELAIDEVPVEEGETAHRRLGEILVARGDVRPDDIAEELGHQRRLGQLLVESGKVSEDRIAAALGEQRHLREVVRVREGAAGTIRVPAERLDSLMDQVGELVIAQARLMQVASAEANPLLKSISEDIARLAAELRDTTMTIRMVPIGTLFGRFRRVVHDLSRDLGKTVEFSMAGEETELDKTVIESLNDPLVHLIRNAIDHGIDDPASREAQGKPAAGHLHLSAMHSGAQVLITIEDDGRGLNRAAIRAKAEESGLLQPGQDVSEADLFGCIFHPGFSTAAAVTNISGRGVGMDVVKRTIAGLRGTIEVASPPGQGTTITLRLPLTLAIIDGLLVRLGDERYVVPLSAVDECVELTRAQDKQSEGRSFLNIRDEIVPYIRLRTLFAVPGEPDPIQKVVVVSLGDSWVGLVVDQVIGQHQTVIKSLSRLHRDQEGFSGATILGDGTVALILDIPHLIKFARSKESSERTF